MAKLMTDGKPYKGGAYYTGSLAEVQTLNSALDGVQPKMVGIKHFYFLESKEFFED